MTDLTPTQLSVLPRSATPSSNGDVVMTPISIHDSPQPTPAVGTNLFTQWMYQRLFSRDRVERHYSFLIAMLCGSSILFACLKASGPIYLWGSPLCSMWACALLSITLLNVWAESRDKYVWFEATRGIQFVLVMLSVLIYYDGSNVVNRARFAERGAAMLYDTQLLRMDEFLLGWLYPRGQLALYLDTQPEYGVATPIGRLYAEIFQILYISYYIWGNAIGIYLAGYYFWFAVYKKNKGTKKRMQWRRIQMFATAWVGAFVLNHLVNLCFPAMSPRIFIADQYQNELRGLWVLAGLRNAVTKAAASTYSAFPSGHCGLSILAVILSFRCGLSKAYSYAVLLSSALIVLATQVLRYHYFVDFLFSLPIVFFGCWLGGFHQTELYERSLVEMGLEDHDEDGKPMTGGASSPSMNGGSSRAEHVPLISSGSNGSSASTGLTASASRTKLSLSPDERDIELGQINNPPLILSSQIFGNSAMTRSVSSARVHDQALGKIEEGKQAV